MRLKQPRQPASSPQRPSRRRRGVILLAVLVALVLLALAGYQYSDLMLSEYRAAHNAHRTAQARALADSGIHYAAALLASPDNINNLLGGNIYDNPQYFMDIEIPAGEGAAFGRFTLIAPQDATAQSSQGVRYGVVDEGAKLNLNVLIQLDPTGDRLYNALLLLPNMTTDIANAIVDWVDADNTPRDGGAEDDYYAALSPPYHVKNGPLESLEELLLVRGVTPQLLFGADLNRNGVIDPDEDDSAGMGLGWSAFLTIYSREQNSDSSGTPFNYLNASDISTLYQNLSSQVDDSVAKFIILYRQYGSSNSTSTGSNGTGASGSAMGGNSSATTPSSTSQSGKTGSSGQNSNQKPAQNTTQNTTQNTAQPTGDLSNVELDLTKQAKNKITSLWSLVNAQVTVPGSGTNQKSVTYASPLSDPSNQANLLPLLFSLCTLSESNEIPARININTAPQEVLGTLPELQDTDIQTILSTRPQLSSSEAPDAVFQTPAWLLTKANLTVDTLQKLEPYITTRSQVYRVQSVGYFDDGGLAARVEAIIDTNGGRPRIIAYRDLTSLGKGWSK